MRWLMLLASLCGPLGCIEGLPDSPDSGQRDLASYSHDLRWIVENPLVDAPSAEATVKDAPVAEGLPPDAGRERGTPDAGRDTAPDLAPDSGAPDTRQDFSCKITQLAKTEAISHQQVTTVTKGAIIDAPMSIFTRGNPHSYILPSVVWNAGDYVVWHSVTKGSLEHPAASLVGSWPQWEFFKNSTHGNNHNLMGGRKWLCNTYHDSSGGVVGFVHVEYALNGTPQTMTSPGNTRIGIAYDPSPDSGAPAFTYLGAVIAPYQDPAPFNIQGVPYLIRNHGGKKWFYIYFHDNSSGRGHIGVARSPVVDVVAQAKLGLTSSWEKYNRGSWSANPAGPSSPTGLWPIISHGDAARSLFNGRYYFVGTVQENWPEGGVNPSAIKIFESCDGLSWTLRGTFGAATGVDVGWQYVNIIDSSGTDNGEVGQTFFIYAGYEYRSTTSRVERLMIRLEQSNCPCP